MDGVNCGFYVMVNMYLLIHDLPLQSVGEDLDMDNFRLKALLASMDGQILNHPLNTREM